VLGILFGTTSTLGLVPIVSGIEDLQYLDYRIRLFRPSYRFVLYRVSFCYLTWNICFVTAVYVAC